MEQRATARARARGRSRGRGRGGCRGRGRGRGRGSCVRQSANSHFLRKQVSGASGVEVSTNMENDVASTRTPMLLAFYPFEKKETDHLSQTFFFLIFFFFR